ncbi:hypothetical protein PYCCODRAFT_1386837 [Trametes coccinea BRFM310]|uniref:MutL C-terminal dimerisation domain-containing protein n=1 Tax=Trametes coccinea (strain BRFM310) TaxID=1353009 RepID=A0A1Y2IU06_TRAC3|nr:hypothetical protein PYCCODRAFT_1386837 [Trametes coccinea BRFM310]
MSFLRPIQSSGTPAEQYITSLPSSTQSRLRSTQILTSLPQLVSELVQNSLDAGARNVEISLDAAEWECWVRDDGAGISKEGLSILSQGSERGRYGTSKAYTPASLDEVTTFGFRGEALASTADISCLEISSRTKHSREAWSVILKGGEMLYAGSAMRWRRESPGTVVSVRDAFYNLPIRRRAHPNPIRTLELVKRDIESFALMFPGVSFTLENTTKARGGAHGRSKIRVLSVPKTTSTLVTFRHLYGRALADHVAEVDEVQDDMRLEGFISFHGGYSKAYQFLYINKHLLGVCELHRAIEAIFAASSFSKHAYEEMGKVNSPTPYIRRSLRKTEKKPVYVLNLTIPPRFIDNCLEPAKAAIQLQNSTAAGSLLLSVVRRILVENGFLSVHPERPRQPAESAASPRKRQKLTRQDLAPRLSGEFRQFAGSACSEQAGSVLHATAAETPTRSLRSVAAPEELDKDNDTAHVLWTDPSTGERYIVDTRTGNSYPELAPPTQDAEGPSAVAAVRARKTLGAPLLPPTPGTNEVPAWIAEALAANDAYRLAERKIMTLPTTSEPIGQQSLHDIPREDTHRPRVAPRGHAEPAWDAPRIGRLTSTALRTARVLGQVDRKFIACVMRTQRTYPQTSTSELEDAGGVADALCLGSGLGGRRQEGTLVLIDQHAADERVRVERFLRELCQGFLASVTRPPGSESGEVSVRTRMLVPPVNVLLTRREASRLEDSVDLRSAFARWGVVLAVSPGVPRDYAAPSQEDESYSQVAVETVPEVIADKLLAGDELRELIKSYLAKLETDGADALLPPSAGLSQGSTEALAHGWQRALRYCPRALIDLVNSKACRGAIMFNDALTLEQCRTLLDRLAETALPFQCAHGRRSLVPLVETSGEAMGARRAAVDWEAFMGRSTT